MVVNIVDVGWATIKSGCLPITVSAVLQPALLCVQFADSAGNIAACALIQTNTLYYGIFWKFSSVFIEIIRGRGLFHVTATCKHLCYIVWKGYLPPFDPALKGIKFPFAACKKGLETACKIQKIRENTRVLHAVVEYLPAACKRVADCL